MVTKDFGFGLKGTAKIFNQPFKYKPTAKIGYLKLTKGS
jgi:hypothetical protein